MAALTDLTIAEARAGLDAGDFTAAELAGAHLDAMSAADDLNVNAANAVLKTLEEPPERGVLFLVSHAPGRLLPTIRSRCRRLTLQPLGEDTVIALLRRYGPALSEGDAECLSRLCEGSIGLALSFAERDGLTLYGAMFELMQRLPVLDVVALDWLGDQAGGSGSDEKFAMVRQFFRRLMTRLIRTALLQDDDRVKGAISDEQRALGSLAPAAGLDRWLEVWEKSNELLARAENANLDRKQVGLDLFLTLQSAVRS